MGEGDEFMPDGRGLLGLHSNGGITFDLAAICQAHPNVLYPVRFSAFAGLGHRWGLVDLWVFIDGQLKFRRTGLVQTDTPLHVEVVLRPSDRFLTLVCTDGNLKVGCDWAVFGDPVLHVALRQGEK